MAYPAAPMAKGKGAIQWLALAGVVGPILFVALFTLAGLLRPGYSAIRDLVSDLGIGPNAWIQNANFTLCGLLLIAFAIAFYQGMDSIISKGWRVVCLVLLVLSGLGMIGAGYFHVPNPGDPPELQLRQAMLHLSCFLLIFVSSIILFFITGWQLRGKSGWNRFSWYSLITGLAAILLVFLVFQFSNPQSTLQIGGLVVRILVLVTFAWHVLMGWRLYELERS